MKKVNGMTVYEADDPNELDVYSQKIADEIKALLDANKYDDTTIKKDITNIKAEQTTQNNNIEANSTAIETNAEAIEQNKEDITDLQAENANLKAQIPTGTAAGEEISLQDSAEMELVDFNLQGNSYQQNEPTLENQSEVQAVGDNINIFDDTVEKVTSIINDSGNEVADTGTNDFYKQIIIPDSKKYIMSYEKNNQGFVRMAYYNGDTFISRQYSNQNGFIFTVPDNCNKIDCRTNAGTNNEIKFTNLKIEKGEVATSYSPYNQGSVEIVKSNKNLLSFEYKTGNGITFDKNRITIIDPTGYLYAGKTLVEGNSFLSGKKVIFTTISNGTISGTLDFTVHTNKVQYRFQKEHTTGKYNNDIKSEGFMFANDEYITSIFVYTTGATSNLTIDVQVSIADEDFIEHQGNAYSLPIQKPFYKIGDYADAFIKQNNKWYEKHYIKELSLTGDDSETWTAKITDTFSKYQWSRALSDKLNILNSQIFCTHFKQITVAQSDALNIEGIANGLYPDYSLMIVTDKIKSLADFKTKLKELYESGNPIKIYYILKTPELIECTEEQTQVLEQIIADGTYKGVTHFYTTDETHPSMNLEYYKDLETLLNNIQTQLLNQVGGN